MSFLAQIDIAKHLITPYTNHRVVKLSSLKEYFIDRDASEMILREKDPVIYEYYEKTFENEEENMNFGITILYPGKIGREYFMTRGHFHVKRKPEIYLGLVGDGLILMQSSDGRVEWQPLEPNSVVYVPPGMGHRTVNTGKQELVFFFAYPADAGHDYETVRQKGFAKLVVDENGRFALVDNPKYLV